jgi:hypothetical protein
MEVSAMEKNADSPKSAANIKPCSLKTLRSCEILGQAFLNNNILCPITPYPALTTPSDASTLLHPKPKPHKPVHQKQHPFSTTLLLTPSSHFDQYPDQC